MTTGVDNNRGSFWEQFLSASGKQSSVQEQAEAGLDGDGGSSFDLGVVCREYGPESLISIETLMEDLNAIHAHLSEIKLKNITQRQQEMLTSIKAKRLRQNDIKQSIWSEMRVPEKQVNVILCDLATEIYEKGTFAGVWQNASLNEQNNDMQEKLFIYCDLEKEIQKMEQNYLHYLQTAGLHDLFWIASLRNVVLWIDLSRFYMNSVAATVINVARTDNIWDEEWSVFMRATLNSMADSMRQAIEVAYEAIEYCHHYGDQCYFATCLNKMSYMICIFNSMQRILSSDVTSDVKGSAISFCQEYDKVMKEMHRDCIRSLLIGPVRDDTELFTLSQIVPNEVINDYSTHYFSVVTSKHSTLVAKTSVKVVVFIAGIAILGVLVITIHIISIVNFVCITIVICIFIGCEFFYLGKSTRAMETMHSFMQNIKNSSNNLISL